MSAAAPLRIGVLGASRIAANAIVAPAAVRVPGPSTRWSVRAKRTELGEAVSEGGVTRVVIRDYPVAAGYNVGEADIFLGKVTTWNDPKIAENNEGVELPDAPINVFYRSDESGTSDNFQKFLAASTNGDWDASSGKQFPGVVGEGADKSTGVANAVQTIPGSITYVESGFATANDLARRLAASLGIEPAITTAGDINFGIALDEPNLQILMRHRAVLFGLLGALLVAAAFIPALRNRSTLLAGRDLSARDRSSRTTSHSMRFEPCAVRAGFSGSRPNWSSRVDTESDDPTSLTSASDVMDTRRTPSRTTS